MAYTSFLPRKSDLKIWIFLFSRDILQIYYLQRFLEKRKDLAGIKKNEPAVFIKAKALLAELQQHPRTGTGNRNRLDTGTKVSFPEESPKNIG